MKSILTTAIGGVALLAGPALAADLPSRKEPPVAPIVYVPVFTWTGFYVGLNAGGAWTSTSGHLNVFGFNGLNGGVVVPGYATFPLFNNGNNNNNGNFTGGGQIGYNYQIGAFVWGVEADINYLGNNSNRTAAGTFFYGDPLGPLAGGVVGGARDPYSGYYRFLANKNNNHYFGTVRARLGYAVDRALFFVTGGLAYGGSNNGSAAVGYYGEPLTVGGPVGPLTAFYGTNGGFGGNNNSSHVGWTAGAGVEYAWTNNWTVKLEYLYANLGNNGRGIAFPASYTLGGVIFTPNGSHYINAGNKSANVNILRMGVNYKF
jgi:outer membrane immunogenic protein